MDVDASALAEGCEAALSSPCPLCGGMSHDVIARTGRDGDLLTTAMCIACGHVFTSPVPTEAELSAYYAEKYREDYKRVAQPKPKHVLRAGKRALERLEILSRHKQPPARLLDVGAGGGEFVYLAAKAGYAAQGIEPNRGYAAHARDALGADVVAATFQDARVADGDCDVVTIHHVLEHLPDPMAALAQIRSWLAPGGVLMLEVPNIASTYHAPARRFHRAHIQTFNETGLEDAIANAGFDVRETYVAPHTAHLGVIAFRSDARAAQWRDTAVDVRTLINAHTTTSYVLSGRALQRLWSNLKRPIAERTALRRLDDRSPRAILDSLRR